jgi:hypothetical protein
MKCLNKAIGFLLFLLLLFPVCVNAECNDTDGGGLFAKGTVAEYNANGIYRTETDFCNDQYHLVEYYCRSDTHVINAVLRTCFGGCIDGACMPTNECPLTDASAEYPDGRNPYIKGVFQGFGNEVDQCRDDSVWGDCDGSNNCRVYERFCWNGVNAQQYISCPHGCYDGACVRDGCCKNSECGTDGWLENEYCNGGDVWDVYKTWACNDPGTTASYCASSGNGQLKEACNCGCENGICLPDTRLTVIIASPANATYAENNIDLNWSVNKIVDWAAYSLNGADNVGLTFGNETWLPTIENCHHWGLTSSLFGTEFIPPVRMAVSKIKIVLPANIKTNISITNIDKSSEIGACSEIITGNRGAYVECDLINDVILEGGKKYFLKLQFNQSENAKPIRFQNDGNSDTQAYFWDGTKWRTTSCGGSPDIYYSYLYRPYLINTTISAKPGANYVTVFANDTTGNISNSTVYFTIPIPICHNNSECGTDGWINSDYCNGSNVWGTYRTYSCSNPGKSSASCSYSDNNQEKEKCEFGCDNNSCLHDPCLNVTCNDYCDNYTYYSDGSCIDGSCVYSSSENNSAACGFYSECYSDEECGTNGWLNLSYCNRNEIWGTYRTYSCSNPGTISSSCSYLDVNQSKQLCSEACENGLCISVACGSDKDCGNNIVLGATYCQGNNVMQVSAVNKCRKPGTNSSYCEQVEEALLVKECRHRCHMGVCIEPAVKCNVNSDCGDNGAVAEYCSGNDVWQDYRTWTCINPGTNEAYCRYSDTAQLVEICSSGCVDAECANAVCSSDSDCGENRWVKSPYCIGNDAYQKYRTWTCAGSGCEHNDEDRLKQSCTHCSGGLCVEGNEQSDDIEISNFIRQTRAPRAGGTVTLAFTIQNNGDSPVGNLQWTLDTGAGTTIISSVGEFGAGEKQIIMRQVVYPSAGTYNASVTVDPDNKITESNEENNKAITLISVS